MKAWAIFLVILNAVNCAIIQSDFSSIGFSSFFGKKLDDTPLTSFETKSWTRCLLSCRNNTQCNSVNLSPSMCELLTSQVRNEDELQDAPGWIHLSNYTYIACCNMRTELLRVASIGQCFVIEATDACLSSPCTVHENCQNIGSSYTCGCDRHYTGSNCETGLR